jgi:hypothetical protein
MHDDNILVESILVATPWKKKKSSKYHEDNLIMNFIESVVFLRKKEVKNQRECMYHRGEKEESWVFSQLNLVCS